MNTSTALSASAALVRAHPAPRAAGRGKGAKKPVRRLVVRNFALTSNEPAKARDDKSTRSDPLSAMMNFISDINPLASVFSSPSGKASPRVKAPPVILGRTRFFRFQKRTREKTLAFSKIFFLWAVFLDLPVDKLHVHFGAGRLGFGLVLPALEASGSPYVIINRPSAVWQPVVERERETQQHVGVKVRDREKDTPGSHSDIVFFPKDTPRTDSRLSRRCCGHSGGVETRPRISARPRAR